MAYRLCLARQNGWNLESVEIGTWLFHFGFTVAQSQPPIEQVFSFAVVNHRVPMCRNMCIQAARRHRASHILAIDPDMSIDRYVEGIGAGDPQPGAKSFWREAWPFAVAHPGSIVAAPYRGGHEDQPVHAFVRDQQNHLVRVRQETAARLTGWTSVEAIGAGCMLIDMAVFDKLDEAYFYDTYVDKTQTDLRHSSDVEFSLRCRAAGIPLYVNWDCWCGHWQLTCTERPGLPQKQRPKMVEEVSADPSVPVLREPLPYGKRV